MMINNIEFLNFIDLSLEEKKMILSWRNNIEIKKWFYDDEIIELSNHLKFIETLKKSTNKLYFLLKKNNSFLGVIDFTNINDFKSCEFGLYKNPELRGVGKVLLELICRYAFDVLKVHTLHAEVFSNNLAAIALYKKFEFIKTKKKTVNNKEVICMELKNENR